MGKQSCYHLTGYSGVAQLAERRTVNPQVVGSIPTPGAVKRGSTRKRGAFLFAPWWAFNLTRFLLYGDTVSSDER